MIEAVEPAHKIVRNPGCFGDVRANAVDLQLLIGAVGVGDEVLEFQPQPRVMPARNREGNLVPVEVGLAPVGGGPVCVEVVERAIAKL